MYESAVEHRTNFPHCLEERKSGGVPVTLRLATGRWASKCSKIQAKICENTYSEDEAMVTSPGKEITEGRMCW